MKRLHPVIMTVRPLRFVKTDGTKHRLLPFWGTLFCRQTDILSNITPQASAHNQGAWQRLEVRVTALAAAGNIAVYVLTNPLFERLTAPLPSGPLLERVPSAYWKVTPDWKRWAEAIAIEKRFGDAATAFIAERIAPLPCS